MAYQPNKRKTGKKLPKRKPKGGGSGNGGGTPGIPLPGPGRLPKRVRKSRRVGIGAGEVITGATDVCVPIWAALIIGGLGAYGAVKAVGK